MVRALAIVSMLAGCSAEQAKPGGESEALFATTGAPLAEVPPGPTSAAPTGDTVHGQGCAYPTSFWLTPGTLDGVWEYVGVLEVGGSVFGTPEALASHLQFAEEFEAQHATLALNVVLNTRGALGAYADLGAAQIAAGPLAGTTASDLVENAHNQHSEEVLEAMVDLNASFANCPASLVTDNGDDDGDGVPNELDCEPDDAAIGAVLYRNELDGTPGNLAMPEQLDGLWSGQADSLFANQGGQQARLGDERWEHVVVRAEVGAHGSEVGCGFDCAESCGEWIPQDCYEPWEALALGILDARSTGTGTFEVTNTGDYAVCLDNGYTLWDGIDTQAVTMGSQLAEIENPQRDERWRIEPGETLTSYWGSWTTENGVDERYSGELPWWCYQRGVYFNNHRDYWLTATQAPDDLVELTHGETDLDGDGVEDHVDWTGGSSVQTQRNVWEYQETHAMVVVGKKATTSPAAIEVTWTVENRGALDATTVTLSDTIAEGWELVSCDAPVIASTEADGSSSLGWTTSVDGCENDCKTVHSEVLTCTLTHTVATDHDRVVLGSASAAYFDGDDMEESHSLPAVVFDYDHDGDGEILCGHTDRWRVGVLARATLDDDQDEGYHGYRCAVARNPDVGCRDPGHFLQIAEFEDGPEDNIDSECEGDCPANTTFDQLARTESGGVDLVDGDRAELSFYAVGDELHCTLESDGETIEAQAPAVNFSSGSVGLSTLNAFGDYTYLEVCEAFALP